MTRSKIDIIGEMNSKSLKKLLSRIHK